MIVRTLVLPFVGACLFTIALGLLHRPSQATPEYIQLKVGGFVICRYDSATAKAHCLVIPPGSILLVPVPQSGDAPRRPNGQNVSVLP